MAKMPDVIDTLEGADKAIYDDIESRRAAKGVHHLGPYVPLANYPQLAKYIERLGFFYKYESELPADIYQFVVLEVGRQSGVEFVWRDHVEKARAAGVPDAVISAIASGDDALEEPYGQVRALMDWAFRFQSIPEEIQAAAVRRFGAPGVLEIVTLCGFYTMIGMINTCFDVPLPTTSKRSEDDR